MAQIPESKHTTAHAIVNWYERKPQEHRPHMGASIIGHPCSRNVWLTWRWAMKPTFEGRVLRLFDTGKREEMRILEELRGIGAEVWDTDPATGNQWTVSAHNGHFGGSLDGVAKGLPEAPKTAAVLEFKTHSAKSFADLVKNKVEASKPQHYAQMQVYMGLMELTRALYIAVNKDTDDLYTEWVEFSKEAFDSLMVRASMLLESPVPPQRISDDPSHWQCKWCSFWAHCHNNQAAEANCRTCSHSTPVANSEWGCEFHQGNPPLDAQRKGCGDHLMIPALVPYGEPVDGGEGWVAYRHRETGALFTNGAESVKDYGPVFSSKELEHCPGTLLEGAAELKAEFPGAKVISGTFASSFDDLATHPDDIPVKADAPKKKEARKKVSDALKALEEQQ